MTVNNVFMSSDTTKLLFKSRRKRSTRLLRLCKSLRNKCNLLKNGYQSSLNSWLLKSAEVQSQSNEILAFEKQMTYLSAKLDCYKAQNSKDKTLLDGLHTALALHNTAFQKRISNYVNQPEKLPAERATLDVDFKIYCADSNSTVYFLQATLESETDRTDKEAKDRKRMFMVVKALNAQL